MMYVFAVPGRLEAKSHDPRGWPYRPALHCQELVRAVEIYYMSDQLLILLLTVVCLRMAL